jgi:hypothetical protein
MHPPHYSEGLIGWREFARLHGVAETTIQKAAGDVRLRNVAGEWKAGRVWVRGALDTGGQRRFYELWLARSRAGTGARNVHITCRHNLPNYD